MKNKQPSSVCIQFSGGSDSSLTAYRMAQKFDYVHLLTFKHFGQIDIENSKHSYSVLNDKFPGKFTHTLINVGKTLTSVYHRHYMRNLIRYGSLQMQFTCFACQASFHIHTIIYCKKNGISEVRDGANTEYEEASPMQIEIVKREIKKLYAGYGINHDSPIYDEYNDDRSDHQLYQLGLRPQPNIKDDDELYKAYQGYCRFMPGSVLFLNYWKRRSDFPEKVQRQMLQHWQETVGFMKRMIDGHIKSDK